MEYVFLTGMSGSGKTRASIILEDMGYYCIENLPSAMIESFAGIYSSTPGHLEKVVFINDVRGETDFGRMSEEIKNLRSGGFPVKIIYLDCQDSVLVNRYKETRRIHPLVSVKNISMADALTLEKEMLRPVRQLADYCIDTSNLSVPQLKDKLLAIVNSTATGSLVITCVSFGYKYGITSDADLVFDVRCFPNPFYVPELRDLTGLDEPVRSYVFFREEPNIFLKKMTDLVDFLIPLYAEEGKTQLTVAIGCTGGKHRSVAMTEALSNHLRSYGMNVVTVHRDIIKKFIGDK